MAASLLVSPKTQDSSTRFTRTVDDNKGRWKTNAFVGVREGVGKEHGFLGSSTVKGEDATPRRLLILHLMHEYILSSMMVN
jgi:hypothetical protein